MSCSQTSDPGTRACCSPGRVMWHVVVEPMLHFAVRKALHFGRTQSMPTAEMLWRSVDALMCRGHVPHCHVISSTEFHKFFDAMIKGVHAAIADAPLPSFSSVLATLQSARVSATGPHWPTCIARQKSANDPLATCLLQDNGDMLSPLLFELYNNSFHTGSVPMSFKSAHMTLLLAGGLIQSHIIQLSTCWSRRSCWSVLSPDRLSTAWTAATWNTLCLSSPSLDRNWYSLTFLWRWTLAPSACWRYLICRLHMKRLITASYSDVLWHPMVWMVQCWVGSDRTSTAACSSSIVANQLCFQFTNIVTLNI